MFSSSNSIDWGTLAQQWIQMKDNPNVAMADTSSAANIAAGCNSGNGRGRVGNHDGHSQVVLVNRQVPAINKKITFEEQGEADMELADDEDHSEKICTKSINNTLQGQLTQIMQNPSVPPANETSSVMQPQWFVQQPQPAAILTSVVSTPLPPPAPQWNIWPPRVTVPPPNIGTPLVGNPTAHIPSLMKINIPNPNTLKSVPEVIEPILESPPVTVTATEAAKRKVLPAWIREGLEKIEREKQKQMEREQQNHSKEDVETDSPTKDEKGIIFPNEYMVKESIATLGSESSGNEDDDGGNGNVNISQHNSDTVEQLASETLQSDNDNANDNSDIDGKQISVKSYEQKLQDLMIVVRGTLTELLLEVTNDEIANIAQETLKSRKTKASSVQVIRKSDLTTITGKLGLAAYADSSSDENDDTDEQNTEKDDGNDSEDELQATIRMKRRAFSKVAEEIEQRIAATAAREEQKLKYYTQMEQTNRTSEQNSSSTIYGHNKKRSHDIEHNRHYASEYCGSKSGVSSSSVGKSNRDFGETTTVSKLHYSNGKRHKDRLPRKERTTRFSDNKERKSSSSVVSSNHMNFMSPMQNTLNPTNPEHATAITTNRKAYVGTSTAVVGGNNSGGIAGSSSASGVNLNTIMNAADVVIEKANKIKSSTTKRSYKSHHNRHHNRERDRDRQHRSHSYRRSQSSRNNDSSSNSSSSSNSGSSSASSSPNSKYSRQSRSSSTRHKHHQRDDHGRSRHRTNSSSYRGKHRYKSESKSKSKSKRRCDSSDSDDDHRTRQRSNRRSRSRSRSKSRSSYSSSTNRSNRRY